MKKGNIKVSMENIFPLIKKFLYSDHEIFLRELISNATDATLKLKHLIEIGEIKSSYNNPIIEVKVDKENKKIHIIDEGIGMSVEEIDKYINQIAFSGAEEFIKKYKDKISDSGIIGHFGLGFYSSFMVSKKVEIFSKTYQDNVLGAHWICDGSPEFYLDTCDKNNRGTEIILYIAEDSEEFLDKDKIRNLLVKYNKFMPIPIKFGTKKRPIPANKSNENTEIKEQDTEEIDDIINNTNPIWKKNPIDLKDEDYKNFYSELYPMQFDEPLFNIHLNVDYPFNLTGVLYFPKLGHNIQIQKDKIQLYQNQVFITEDVSGIVPDFLTMLRGVIDSPDVPLNVSRSHLQSDSNVKKISSYITRKIADKLLNIYTNQKEEYQKKWNDIKIVIEYGMISDQQFFDKSDKFVLYPTIKKEYFLLDEYIKKVSLLQTNKDGKVILLYASNINTQHSYIQEAYKKQYEVLFLDSPIVSHLIQKLEMTKKNIQFVRVDANSLDKLIEKDINITSKLSDDKKQQLKKLLENVIPSEKFVIELEPFSSVEELPMKIVQPEFMRRMKEQNQFGSGMFGIENNRFPDTYQLIIDTNSLFAEKILSITDDDLRNNYIKKAFDLVRLSNNLLIGEELTSFIKLNFKNLF